MNTDSTRVLDWVPQMAFTTWRLPPVLLRTADEEPDDGEGIRYRHGHDELGRREGGKRPSGSRYTCPCVDTSGRGGDPVGLSGTFDCLGAKATFKLFSTAGLTGRLTIRTRSAQASLLLVEGQLAGGFSAAGSELSMADGWPELAEEICSRAFRSPRTAFDFTPKPDTQEHPHYRLIRLEQLVERAAQRAASWKEVEAVIASPDVVPRLADSLAAGVITLDRQQWMLVAQTDGRRSVAALSRRVGLQLLQCCQLVTALAEAGAMIIPPGPASVRCAPPLHVPEADAESDLAGSKAIHPVDPAQVEIAVAALPGANGESAPELPAVMSLSSKGSMQ